MRTLTLTTVLVVCAACGSEDSNVVNNTSGTNNLRTEPNNVSPNNRGSNNGSSNNTANTNTEPANNTSGPNDTSTNNSPTNNSPNNTTGGNNNPGTRTESEPNDDRAGANGVVLGDTILGTAEPGGEDVFEFTGPAGSILELEVVAADPTLDVSIFVEAEAGDVGDRVIDLTAGSKRQFFMPEFETYFISIRSFDPEARDYEIVIREVTPSPIDDDFWDTIVSNLNDRAVDVYQLPDVDGRVDAVLEAERLLDGSELDSMMFVYNPTEGLVEFNDDAMTTTDSELDFTAAAGESYWLVVDAWRLGSNNPYELTVSLP